MALFSKKNDLLFAVLIALAVLAVAAWTRPLPKVKPDFSLTLNKSAAAAPAIAWPSGTQAAIGASGYGLLATSGPAQPVPTASVAKTITALAVLRQKPLKPGQQGPLITITDEDQAVYDSYYSQGGSIVPVTPGEQISERQALEAMLLPSANNMAYTLARWAFGSLPAYTAYANQFSASLGLKNTHIADASGFSPSTISTAEDLVKIGQVVANDPVLAPIVAERQANVPVAGTIHNVNWLLGTDGINGIKTGNTDEAGGVFLFSAQKTIAGRQVTIIGAVMGAPTLEESMADSRSLLASVPGGFTAANLVDKDKVVGRYLMPWGKSVPVVTADDLNLLSWYQKTPASNLSGESLSVLNAGQVVGKYYATSGIDTSTVNLRVTASSGSPPWQWRLFSRYF